MEPVEALERIAYLLDRAREKPFKPRAYTRAAEVVKGLEPGELGRRIADGTLTELEHIGPKTAAVITEAASGEVPEYLTHLEEATGITPGAGSEILDALRGDCHTHSTWSDGGADIETMARAGRALGHDYMVLTDHSPRLTIANGLTAERLREQLDVVAGLNEVFDTEATSGDAEPFRLLTGIEVDILDDGTLDQDEGLLAELDIVVASVHSKLRMEKSPMTRRMCVAAANPHVDILGHCTGRIVVGRGRPESLFDPDLVFHACEQFGTAVEINCRPERLDPPMRLLEVAIDMGCMFSVDTDAHAPGQLEWQPYGADRAAEAGVDIERIINTRSLDDLLAGRTG